MNIYSDNIICAEKFLPDDNFVWKRESGNRNDVIVRINNKLFSSDESHSTCLNTDSIYSNLFIAERAPKSQYDILIELAKNNVQIPHGTLCLAGAGSKFHGFRDRHWDAPNGNIYLSLFLKPDTSVDNIGFAFTVLAAVSVIDTIDRIDELQGLSGIKWVNDILIRNSKVSGFLTHTFAEGNILTGAIIGIGLNVESSPLISPTIFVPKAACLNDFTAQQSLNKRDVLKFLLESLENNYNTLIQSGSKELIEKYKSRSIILGRKAIIYSDKPGDGLEEIANGTIKEIGDNLELHIDSENEPITRGRLALI